MSFRHRFVVARTGLVVTLLVVFSLEPRVLASEAWQRQVLVKARNPAGGPRLADDRRVPAGARVLRSLPLPGWRVVELPDGMNQRQGVDWFRGRPDVSEVEPNVRWKPHATPDDPEYGRLYGLDRIGAPSAWNASTGGSNVVVAVLDTGLTATHPDLEANVWHNAGEIPGNGLDDDGNGWIDDTLGWDFMDNDADPSDDAGHGTHVAGTIGAVGNNGRGVVGVCWTVQVMGIRVGAVDAFGSTAELVQAFDYVVAMRRRGVNVRVINCSWGGGYPSAALKEAICQAGAEGILVVCSAGNDRQDNDALPAYPSGYDCPQILSVAASSNCDDPASFSNVGRTTVHLAAPGVGVLSTFRGTERYAVLSGTSMAAPHVSGAAALLFSRQPNLNVADLRAILLDTVDRLPSWTGRTVSGGRLNVARAMARAAEGTIPVPPSPSPPATMLRVTSASRAPDGRWGDGNSLEPALSADGRWVAFSSSASNLVSGDVEGQRDVFLRDCLSNQVYRVSQTREGKGGNDESSSPAVSADGRVVTFVSAATNLVSGDGNRVADVFVWDRESRRIELVSLRADGRGAGDGLSELPSISADGSLVAFASDARDLVAGDRNDARDVFLRDRVRGVTGRVSVSSDGTEAQGWSDAPSISGDGRAIAFHSSAANLVAADDNDAWDVFVHDRVARTTELVSFRADGQTQRRDDSVFPALNGDGRFVLFNSLAEDGGNDPASELLIVFLYDRTTRSLTRVSAPPDGGLPGGDAYVEALSLDGRFATFTSDDPGLAAGGAPGLFRTFVYDRLGGVLGPVAVSDAGYVPDDNAFFARPSRDGRWLAYATYGYNLTPGDGNGVADVFVVDRGDARPDLGVRVAGAMPFEGLGVMNPVVPQRAESRIAPGGSIFEVRMLNGGAARSFVLQVTPAAPAPWRLRILETAGGSEITGAVAGNGWSTPVIPAGSNLTLRIEIDPLTGDGGEAVFAPRLVARSGLGEAEPELDAVTLVSRRSLPPPGFSLVSRSGDGLPAVRNAEVASVSADGLRVAFSSESDRLDTRGDFNLQSDVFLADRAAGTVTRVSDASSTMQGDADSRYPSLSADGSRVAFQSRASNLVPFDSNEVEDVFVRNLASGELGRLSVSTAGEQGNRGSDSGVISAGGRYVVFTSFASNLVPGDTNAAQDVFLRDLETGRTECVSCSVGGAFGNADSESATVTADGRFVLFSTLAENLGPADSNHFSDVYLLDRSAGRMELISGNANGTAANGPSGGGSLSDDGRWVSFFTYASDVLDGAPFSERRAYLLDRASGTLQSLVTLLSSLPAALEPRAALVSPDGNRLAIAGIGSCGTVPTPSQVLVFDRIRGSMQAVSQLRDETPGDDHTFIGHWSSGGRFLSFESYARNLLVERAQPAGEVFLADLAIPGVDALVRREPDGPWRGQGNPSIESRTLEEITSGGLAAAARFELRFRNAGTESDRFSVGAISIEGTPLQVEVRTDGGVPEDVSSAVMGAGWETPPQPPGSAVDLLIRIALLEPVSGDVTLTLSVKSQTDPSREERVRLVVRSDADHDQLADAWERAWFNSLETAGSETDVDGDGSGDRAEYQSATNPTDPNDTLRLEVLRAEMGGRIELRWPSSGRTYYTVERRGGTQAGFVAVTSQPLSANGGQLHWEEEPPVEPGGGLIYRLRAEPP